MRLVGVVAALVGIARVVAMILLILFGLAVVVSPWVDPPDIEIGFAVPASFRLDPERQPAPIAPESAEHVRLEGANGLLKFSPRNRVLVASTAAVLAVWCALLVWVLDQVRGLLHALRARRPFAPANAVRIRRIGYAVIGAELVRSIFAYVGMRYAMNHFTVAGLRFETRVDIDLFAIFCGLVILVIAEAFREGTRLAEEQSLTI